MRPRTFEGVHSPHPERIPHDMVKTYRCKGCGYFHVGPAPEKCPVCGAPQSFFLPYYGLGDLSGTKTLENLKAAFAGE